MLRKRIITLISAAAIFMNITGCGVRNKTAQFQPETTKVTDMTVPDKSSDYGLIYYTPPEEAHIVQLDNSLAGYLDNEILVVAEAGTSRDKIAQLANKYGAEIVGEIEVSGDYQFRFSKVCDIDSLKDIAEKLIAEDIVYDAYPDYTMPVSGQILDPESLTAREINEAWNHNTDGLAWSFQAINAPKAQEELKELYHPPYRIDSVRVGLIDNGFDIEHQDLGFVETFYDNGTNGVHVLDKSHGTHVAGTMAAETGNGIGIDGVYPYGKGNLYGVGDGLEYYSENQSFFETVMSQKIAYAELIVRNVKVINQSQGFNYSENKFTVKKNGEEGVDYQALKKWWDEPSNHSVKEKTAANLGDFFRRMLRAGYDFVIVASAGNDSAPSIGHLESKYNSWNCLISYEQYPEVYDRIIVVGALDQNYNIAWFSNAGERCDIYAPGVKILSTVPGSRFQNTFYNENSKPIEWSGTSMASPHVAGVAAMVWTANNSLTGAEVKKIVCGSISDSSGDYPMVDAYKAVKESRIPTGMGDTDDPEKGAVLGFVVDSDQEEKAIENAEILFTSESTGICYVAYTDQDGHFEITLPAGDYYLDAAANNYSAYSWKDGKETIRVEAGQVLYLDWIKMDLHNDRAAVLPDGITWAVEPEINAEDIIVGDRNVGFDYSVSSPYVYLKRNGKYGLIGYDGEIAVNPKYDSFNGGDFYGLDDFIAVYDSRSGDTMFAQNYNGDGKWKIVEQKKAFGQPGIGTNSTTYFIDENDGKLYKLNSFLNQPEAFFDADASYVVQKINCVRSKYGIDDSSATDEKFYLYASKETEEESFVTKGYKYVCSNGDGYCAWSGTPDNRYILSSYNTVAFSNDKKKWDIYDSLGYLIASDLEPFDCNINLTPWWSPATAFFKNGDYHDSAENTHGSAVPFCATEGWIAVKKNGLYGYLDLDGNEVIPFGVLEDVRPVHNGKAWAKYDGKWGVLSFE